MSLGHLLGAAGDLLITDSLDDSAVAFAEAGGHVLAVLDIGPDPGYPWATGAAPSIDRVTSPALARPISVHSRYGARDPRATDRPLDVPATRSAHSRGFHPDLVRALPDRSAGPLLDFAYQHVLPIRSSLGRTTP